MAERSPTFACDAMCGGLARWLRAIGYDATFSPDIEDSELVEQARRDGRVLISSDSKLFERKVLTSGELPGLFLPRGMKRMDQVRYVVRRLGLTVGHPRCMKCNGQLVPAARHEVAHLVPARSLVWADTFFVCDRCGRAFWNGSHWQKITARRSELADLTSDRRPGSGEDS
jgi:uncharacterized protein with PIN domain